VSTATPPIIEGIQLPDIATWSERAVVALGQNPSAFTGPGTNTYLVGTGPRRILVDTGHGVERYLPVLERAMRDAGCDELQEIVLTHGHPDHIGGVAQVMERFGSLTVKKHPWPEIDAQYDIEITEIGDGAVIETEGATLRAIFTPGHAPDHLCYFLEEDRALITGDNVLGVGTTVIPLETGDLGDYMSSLDRMLASEPEALYPAHGPKIADGRAKIRQYIDHRLGRDRQILAALAGGATRVSEIVRVVYAAYPDSLYPAAGQSVASHLLKLERDKRVLRDSDASPLDAGWRVV
jgi:ribonuclease/clavin/mitogillin